MYKYIHFLYNNNVGIYYKSFFFYYYIIIIKYDKENRNKHLPDLMEYITQGDVLLYSSAFVLS